MGYNDHLFIVTDLPYQTWWLSADMSAHVKYGKPWTVFINVCCKHLVQIYPFKDDTHQLK